MERPFLPVAYLLAAAVAVDVAGEWAMDPDADHAKSTGARGEQYSLKTAMVSFPLREPADSLRRSTRTYLVQCFADC